MIEKSFEHYIKYFKLELKHAEKLMIKDLYEDIVHNKDDHHLVLRYGILAHFRKHIQKIAIYLKEDFQPRQKIIDESYKELFKDYLHNNGYESYAMLQNTKEWRVFFRMIFDHVPEQYIEQLFSSLQGYRGHLEKMKVYIKEKKEISS